MGIWTLQVSRRLVPSCGSHNLNTWNFERRNCFSWASITVWQMACSLTALLLCTLKVQFNKTHSQLIHCLRRRGICPGAGRPIFHSQCVQHALSEEMMLGGTGLTLSHNPPKSVFNATAQPWDTKCKERPNHYLVAIKKHSAFEHRVHFLCH